MRKITLSVLAAAIVMLFSPVPTIAGGEKDVEDWTTWIGDGADDATGNMLNKDPGDWPPPISLPPLDGYHVLNRYPGGITKTKGSSRLPWWSGGGQRHAPPY